MIEKFWNFHTVNNLTIAIVTTDKVSIINLKWKISYKLICAVFMYELLQNWSQGKSLIANILGKSWFWRNTWYMTDYFIETSVQRQITIFLNLYQTFKSVIHKLSKCSSAKVKFFNPSSTFLFKRYILDKLLKHSWRSSMFLIRKNIVVKSVSFFSALNLWNKKLSNESSARKWNLIFSSSFSLKVKPQPIKMKMHNKVWKIK